MIEIITTKHSWLLQGESGKFYKLDKIQRNNHGEHYKINPKTEDLEFLCLCALPKYASSDRKAQAACYTELRRVMDEFVKTL